MVTLAPVHPVYAKIEDEYQRDTQAESQAGAYFEKYLSHIRRLPVVPEKDGAATQAAERRALLQDVEDNVKDALCDLFITGWDAARDEQNR